MSLPRLTLSALLASACAVSPPSPAPGTVAPAALASGETSPASELAAAALERTRHRVRYDGTYRPIAYPGGDVPADTGVCTDVVIRSYRALGVDLQVAVHEDMTSDFAAYPPLWGLARPDPNIDHRRVPNLERFFERQGASLPVTDDPDDYRSGDVVSWRLPSGLPHVGLVVRDARRPLVVHSIGAGPQLEDVLFDYRLVGHYRWPGDARPAP